MNKYKTLGISFIRTSLVPPVAGLILTYLTSHFAIKINAMWIYSAVTMLLSGVYYMVLRAVEVLSAKPVVKKWAGIFIGHPTTVTYTDKEKK